MRVVCISDNHDQNLSTKFGTIPDGDVLVHVGDGSAVGREPARFTRVARNIRNAAGRKFKEILYVPGNHEPYALYHPDEIREIFANYGITMLHDEGITLGDGVTFWASGWLQPHIGFGGEYGGDFHKLWDTCPEHVDVLLTHQPPYSIMDKSGPDSPIPGDRIGSTTIYWEVFRRVRPRLHVFGHNHNEHGVMVIDGIVFVNAALCDDLNQPKFEPVVIDVDTSLNRP